MAIYQGDTKISGAGVAIDSSLSDSSTNPVQNQAVTNALEDIGYDTWQKPADWIDIRSGALPNSVYFLVGHSTDYSTYPTFAVYATVSNSGTYDVFVDGIKHATTASGTETTLNWQTLALTSGYDVTYPAALKTHVVRVTPTLESDTLASIRTNYTDVKGVMWAHFTLTEIGLYRFLSAEGGSVTTDRAPLFEALTTPTNEIKPTAFTGAFNCIKNIKTLPVFVGKGNSYANRIGTNNTFTRSGIKRVHFKDFWVGDSFACFRQCTELESIELENSHIGSDSYIFESCYKLKRLPDPWFVGSLATQAITNAAALEPTVLDLSQKTTYQRLEVRGSSTYFMKGLKGITVSNDAPFNSTTSPQINVAYTGLDRVALINLFKSMPYNVGYTVVGSPTITDGVASGFSSSDNITLPSFKDEGQDLEEAITFSLPTGYPSYARPMNQMGHGTYEHWLTVEAYKGGIGARIGTGEYITTSYSLQLETKYTSRLKRASGVYTLDLLDSTGNILASNSLTTSTLLNNGVAETIRYGYESYSYGQPFSGSIDLKETYIKVNGVPWFRGTAAMTKTCSVVGCTGTASLTQDDKNIALNKGWELTVA